MIHNSLCDNEGPLGYIITPIRVLFVRSQVYFELCVDLRHLVPSEDIIEFTLNVPVFDNLGVPLDILINELSKVSMINFTGYQILYKVVDSPLYIFAGIYPFEEETVYIPVIDPSFPIFIKYRAAGKFVHDLQDCQMEKAKTRRANERVIGDVINLLLQWKYLYTVGIETPQGEFIKHTKEDVARLLNIPRKSLEDYSVQIRLASDFGFDFQLNCREKFGVLRKFNRMMLAKRNLIQG